MLFSLTNPEIAIFMMCLFLFAVLLGFPIAFTLLAMGVGFGYYAYFDPTRMDHLLDNRIFEIVEYAQKNNLKVNFITNGLLLNKEKNISELKLINLKKEWGVENEKFKIWVIVSTIKLKHYEDIV